MKKKYKKVIKITAASLGGILILVLASIAIVVNFIFTPAKLTPVVLQVANQSINAHLNMKSVELTFFSTFPRFGLKLEDGTLVSKALQDTLWNREDSLVSFKECIITVNPIAYLTNNRIVINNIILQDASVYAYKNKEGHANWDIMLATDSTVVEAADTASMQKPKAIVLKNIELKNTNVIFDDRDTKMYARLDSANMQMKLLLGEKRCHLQLKFNNKNVLFWQQGELLVDKIAASVKTDITIDRPTMTWTLKDTELTVNGIVLDAGGTFVCDTVAKTIDVNVHYGLHAPSMENVLKMIPESIVKKAKFSAKGDVEIQGTLKGIYGNEKIPAMSLKIQIKDASAKYDDLPYGIDDLRADFEAYVDLMRNEPSYLNLKIFRFKGAYTDVLADGKVEDLLTDPLITFNTKSTVDLNSLAKTFPLQEGVSITGKLNADLHLKCRLSSLKKQDIGRIKVNGKLALLNFGLKDEKNGFDFTSNATLNFVENNTLEAQAEINHLILNSKQLSSTVEKLTAHITTTNPKDTTHIVKLECTFGMNKLRAHMGDSISLYSGKTNAKLTIEPGKLNASKPLIGLGLRTDSMFVRYDKTKLGLDLAGFDIHAEKLRDSVWQTRGIVGFRKLTLITPEFKLPIRMKETTVTLGDKIITLKNASMRIGRSNLTATGSVSNLYGAMTKGEMLKARLDINSTDIDCNQIMNALAFPEDSLTMETDTMPSDLKIFVIPKNIDFELQTNVKKVTFDKMLFENVHGLVNIKNQTVYMEDLSMRALDADMKTVMVYRASSPKRGYTGFDFRIKDINVGKLVDFIPALDTVVPMLRSFKGMVDFDVAAEAVLDSNLNIKIPTLKAALHIRGDSLVLLDGETFAEISKMLMFKNKKHNVFDSIAVNVTVKDGNVTVYPFLIEIDRYKAAIGGQQGLDMNFNYHISILKSPLPFKAGLNITGNMDKMKFRVGKAKYKDAVKPAEIHKVDSTRMNMGQQIVNRFRRLLK